MESITQDFYVNPFNEELLVDGAKIPVSDIKTEVFSYELVVPEQAQLKVTKAEKNPPYIGVTHYVQFVSSSIHTATSSA